MDKKIILDDIELEDDENVTEETLLELLNNKGDDE